ncbi:MAG: LysR family transcriptional regulator [Ramlibacter sp.]
MTRASDPFDTYLLRVFSTLMAERSVSRAAARLNQSQPAVSAALKKLRDVLGDPLLVKDKQRMVPTERALQLEASVRMVLAEIDGLVAPTAAFEPATTRQTFRIGTPDYLAPPLMASLVSYMRLTAPHARLLVQSLGPGYDYEAALAQGELDVVIGNWPQPPEHLRIAILMEDEVVCLVSKDHPAAGGNLTVASYLGGAHVVPLMYSVTQRGVVESHLAALRMAREATVTVPFFGMAPSLLPGTDLIFTTSRHFAEHHARLLPLAVLRSPIEFPVMRFYQLWHSRTQHSQGQAWLRSLLSAVARTADPGLGRRVPLAPPPGLALKI